MERAAETPAVELGSEAGTVQVPIVLVRALIDAAERLGAPRRELLESAGIDDQDLDRDGVVPSWVEEAVWREAVRRCDRSFGIRAAEVLARGDLRALEYAVRTSPTLADGLRRLVRFDRMLHGVDLFALHMLEDGASLVYQSPHGGSEFAHLAAEFALASVVVMGRDATGVDWSPSEVRFEHDPPEDVAPFEHLFRGSVRFSAPRTELVLDAAVLHQPMAEADPILCEILDRAVRSELEALPSSQPLSNEVRKTILDGLLEGEPGIERAAERIGIGVRMLQKRLQEEGTSYQALLDQVRSSLAERYLEQPELSLAGIAMLLGYSDTSAFHRAFRRWTGMTPGEYRRQRG